jgi:high-affinity nickel permease
MNTSQMYPIGILFGFGDWTHVVCLILFIHADLFSFLPDIGFDTASSIALLAISAIASRGTGDAAISRGKIVVLPVSF